MTKAIVLLTGGIDSVACLQKAIDIHGKDHVEALHVFWNRRLDTELKRASDWATTMGVDLVAVTTGLIGPITRDTTTGYGTYERMGWSQFYVCGLIPHLLSFAFARAEEVGAACVYLGGCSEDQDSFPGLTPDFLGLFSRAMNIGTATHVPMRVVHPFSYIPKRRIIEWLTEKGHDVENTHSCHRPSPMGAHCLSCQGCEDRFNAMD